VIGSIQTFWCVKKRPQETSPEAAKTFSRCSCSPLEADPDAATIVAAPIASVPPPIFRAEGVVIFIDLDPRLGWIGEPLFGAPAIAVLIANHSGGCTRRQSNSAENSQSSGLEILYYAFLLSGWFCPPFGGQRASMERVSNQQSA